MTGGSELNAVRFVLPRGQGGSPLGKTGERSATLPSIQQPKVAALRKVDKRENTVFPNEADKCFAK
jgi:hypothetical protein